MLASIGSRCFSPQFAGGVRAGRKLPAPRRRECRELFTNALLLAANRGLLRTGTERLADRRRRFAEEAEAALAGVEAIGELDYRLRHRAQHLH